MFSRERLIAEMWGLSDVPGPIIEVVQFRQEEFESTCSEESILAFFATKRDCLDPLLFWIKALEHTWGERIIPQRPARAKKRAAEIKNESDSADKDYYRLMTAALFEPLNKEDFVRLVQEYSRGLQKPLPYFLRDFSGYQSGLRMYADWDDVAVVAEFSESYKAFFWQTTA